MLKSASTQTSFEGRETSGGGESGLVSEFVRRLAGGEGQDAVAWLDRYPELGERRTFVLDLAFEEYCHRVKKGDQIEADAFAARFGRFEGDVRRLLSVQNLLAEIPGLDTTSEVFPWPSAGDQLGRFKIIDALGRGGFARVYLASEPAAGDRWLVLKASRQQAGEANILGKLEHPNIVKLHFVEQDPRTRLSLVGMPYCGEATLDDVVSKINEDGRLPAHASAVYELAAGRSRRLPQSMNEVPRSAKQMSYTAGIVEILAQLADALAHAHQQGICHGDVKPSNVLLDFTGRPLLLDFNLSTDGCRYAWQLGGTLPYLPPELSQLILHGDPAAIVKPDERSDVFSLGVLAFELLSGRLPFCGRDSQPQKGGLAALAAAQLACTTKGIPSLRNINHDVDPELQALVESCLHQDVDKRPTAAVLCKRLRSWQSPAAQLRRWVSRHLRGIAAVIASAMLIAVAAWIWEMQREPYPLRELRACHAALVAGNLVEAMAHAERAASAAPTDWRMRAARGEILAMKGEYYYAIEEFRRAKSLCDEPALDAIIGYCYSKEAQHIAAVRSYDTAKEEGFAKAWMLNNLGYEYALTAKIPQARAVLDQAIHEDPGLVESYYNRAGLALLYFDARNPPPLDASIQDANTAIELQPGNPDLHILAMDLIARKTPLTAETRSDLQRHLRQAVALGGSLTKIRAKHYLAEIPEAEEILSHPQQPSPPPLPHLLPPPQYFFLNE